MKKIANTEVPINNVIAERWSPRAFDSSYLIDEESIKSLFEAARWHRLVTGINPGNTYCLKKKMQQDGQVY